MSIILILSFNYIFILDGNHHAAIKTKLSPCIYQKLFKEIRLIGSGSLGTVFKVFSKTDSNQYAIKKIKFECNYNLLLKLISL